MSFSSVKYMLVKDDLTAAISCRKTKDKVMYRQNCIKNDVHKTSKEGEGKTGKNDGLPRKY